MDPKTITTYTQLASEFVQRYEATEPKQLQGFAQALFEVGGKTLDIGAGSGRDTAWLTAHGYPTLGIEPSEGMRAEAARLHPECEFREDSLPDLASCGSETFDK